ncbi:cuticle protein CP14.6-like [Schistocerca piceifrons]|uniref:cuticle protein CP14.6-like n=1 Tax=Schistocerca piceifrons TaxID=274613 RepID=UPI001F5F3D57|nr:cuticle protein CP14.6-like [Schistocerca piceifrons]
MTGYHRKLYISVRHWALLLAAAALSAALAQPQGFAARFIPRVASRLASVIQEFNNFNGIDPWRWGYTREDATTREEEGTVENDELKVRGSYMFATPEGTVHKVGYVADKDGYRASSEPPDQQLLDRLGTNAGLTLVGK